MYSVLLSTRSLSWDYGRWAWIGWMATLEARRNRQVLLKLPADEREDTGLLPFNAIGPWELLAVLGESVDSKGCFWACGTLSSFEDSFPHSFSFKLVCGSDTWESLLGEGWLGPQKLKKKENNLSKVDSSLISWLLYPRNKGFHISVSRDFNILCNFEIRDFSDVGCHGMMEDDRKICWDLRTHTFMLFSFHSFHG